MKRVLVVYEQESTTQLMLCNFLKQYASNTGNTVVCKRSLLITPKLIEWCDIILTIRSMCPYEVDIIRLAKKAGKICISYWDDDLTENNNNLFVLDARRTAMIDVLKMSNAVLSPNSYLSEKLSVLGKVNYAITIDTAVDGLEINDSEKMPNERVRIVYAAGPTHVKDFGSNILNALIRLSRKYPDSFELSFVGVHPVLSCEPEFSVYYHPCMSMSIYRQHMLSQNYDIGIAPLDANEMTKSKYYNKYIDYTLSDLVGIYSNCLPYTLVVKDGYNGFLADDDEDSWFDKLEVLITNSSLRNAMRSKANEVLRDRFNLAKIVSKFDKDLEDLINNSVVTAGECKNSLLASKCKYIGFRCAYLPIAYIKEIGPRDMLERLVNYIQSVKLIKREEKRS